MARSRDDDYEDDDLPRRRRRDDEDDAPRSGELGPLDKMYRDTNTVVLVLFGCCCGIIAFVLSLVAYLTAKDPKAKSNAMLVMIVGIVIFVVSVVAQLTMGLAGGLGGGGR